MKITAKELRQIIKEEIQRIDEDIDDMINVDAVDRFVGPKMRPSIEIPGGRKTSRVMEGFLRTVLGDGWKFKKALSRYKNDTDFAQELLDHMDMRTSQADETFLGDLLAATEKILLHPKKIVELTMFLARQGLL
jgi:hypothetical protein